MDLECPYCGYEYNYNGDYDSDTFEEECSECGKIFFVKIEYYPSYYCSKLPCANEEDHLMEKGLSYNDSQDLWYCQYEGCNYKEWRDK